MYHRTKVLCFKETSPQKKKYSNSWFKGENCSRCFIHLHYNSCSSKSSFRYILPLPSSWWQRRVSMIAGCWHAPDRWVVTGWVGRIGVSLTFDAPVSKPAFNSAKISWLVFLYIWRTNRRSQNVRCHQWNCRKTRDNSCVIILKSRLTLQVILPARARFVTFSLIDDSRCTRALSNDSPRP